MPSGREIAREAVTVLAGAVLAALIVGQLPGLKKWLQDQWKGGCECSNH